MGTTADTITFYKAQGSGNDFVILVLGEDIEVDISQMPRWARRICKRRFSVGADGLIFIEPLEEKHGAAYRWHFYNSDGSRAQMCGNGARCVARLANKLGIASSSHYFLTDVGPIYAEVYPEEGKVKVQLTPPKDLRTHLEVPLGPGEKYEAHFVNTGVPHLVIFVEGDLEEVDVNGVGGRLRFHEMFAPEGTNVNFAKKTPENHLIIRTYERGVEEETYACGTGAAACAYVAKKIGYIDSSSIPVITSGGEQLLLSLEKNGLYLSGRVRIIYEGKLDLKEIGLIQ